MSLSTFLPTIHLISRLTNPASASFQGIHDWEELSRSSAFLIRFVPSNPIFSNQAMSWITNILPFLSRSLNERVKYHIVSAAHVTHPFLYPRLYPEEFPQFLSFLQEKDVKVVLQYRELDTGKLLSEFSLDSHLSVKVDSDLVVGHLEDEDNFELVMKHKFDTKVEPLQLKQSSAEVSSAVELIGHDFSFNANGKPVLVPVSLSGKVLGSSNRRIVVDTPYPSVMGLCGGPVLELSEDGLATPLVVGMVEGRIQNSLADGDVSTPIKEGEVEMHKALADKTVLVSSLDIAEFITAVEKELEEIAQERKIPEHILMTPEFTTVAAEALAEAGAAEALVETAPAFQTWDPNTHHEKDKDIDF